MPKNTGTNLDKLAQEWWKADGVYIDPDTEDVDWFDKRRELAQFAFIAGYKNAQAEQERNRSQK